MGAKDPAEARLEIGNRLAQERDARGLNQEQLAGIVGKSRRSVAAWESGASMPDADALAAADLVGIDVLYVVTGRRGGVPLTAKEQLLVQITRGMPEPAIDAVLHTAQVMGTYAVPKPSGRAGANMTFNADVAQAVGGDVHASNVRFSVAAKPAKPRK
jgi:transcriptional regulator with XRE-family HTH domain